MRRQVFISRRMLLGGLAASMSTGAEAQSYPSRPITIVSPWAPGGGTSNIARIVGDEMAKNLGQPVIVENRPGAGSAVGSEHVARARPDGYTILIAGAGAFFRPAMEPTPYDPDKDFSFVGSIGDGPFLLVARRNLPAETLADLVAHARSRPTPITFASAGQGTTSHLTGELFKSLIGVDLTHVPYRGSAPAIADVLGGHVDILFDPFPTTIGPVRGGQLRAYGVTTPERHALAPDLPTLAEQGLPQMTLAPWWGLVSPAGTPAAITDRLNTALNAALAVPSVADALAHQGVRPFAMRPDAFEAYVRREDQRWRAIVTAANVRGGG